MRRAAAPGLIATALGLLAAVIAATPATAAVGIHAHRGGSVVAGVPAFPENTMAAFRNASREGYTLELDVKLTADRVPVVIHDATLDRTTACSGRVGSKTYAAVRACLPNVLGSPGSDLPSAPVRGPGTEPIPSLAEVLAFAKAEGAYVNLEIKNQPTDPDFDGSNAFADAVMDVVVASGLPRERLIVQSFWPQNLAVAQGRLAGVETSFLTLAPMNAVGPAGALLAGAEWVSPAFPVDGGFIGGAHALGLTVVPYTLDRAADVKAAAALGSDAVITNDPAMAQRALGLTRAQLLPDRLAPVVALSAPAYASDAGTGGTFAVAATGSDRGSGVEAVSLEARRGTNASTPWMPITPGRFRGAAGETYTFRARARDRLGNLSSYEYARTVVPVDDRSRRLRFGRGWRRVRAAGAYGGTVTVARRRGALLRMRVGGSRVAVIARRSRRGGRIRVTLGGRSRVVSLRGRGRRRVVFRSRALAPRARRVTIRALDRGAAIDAIAVERGTPTP